MADEQPKYDALNIVQRMGGSLFLDDLAQALIRVSEDVVQRGQSGGVSVKFKIEPNEGTIMVSVAHQVSAQPPAHKPRAQFYFVHDGGMHAHDPRQVQMDFRTVVVDTGEVVETIDPDNDVRALKEGHG